MKSIRLELSPEQSATITEAGESAFSVVIRRPYVLGKPVPFNQWDLHLVPVNHARAIGALNVLSGTHEARRIRKPSTPATDNP